MKTFEYRTLEQPKSSSISSLTSQLNALGIDGWELVTHDYGVWFFKREVTEEMKQERERAQDVDLTRLKRKVFVNHLADAHDTFLAVGDPEQEHREMYPDCSFQR